MFSQLIEFSQNHIVLLGGNNGPPCFPLCTNQPPSMKTLFFTTLPKTPIWPILILSLGFLVLKSLDLCVCLPLNYLSSFPLFLPQNIHIFLLRERMFLCFQIYLLLNFRTKCLKQNLKLQLILHFVPLSLVSQGCIRLDFHGDQPHLE